MQKKLVEIPTLSINPLDDDNKNIMVAMMIFDLFHLTHIVHEWARKCFSSSSKSLVAF